MDRTLVGWLRPGEEGFRDHPRARRTGQLPRVPVDVHRGQPLGWRLELDAWMSARARRMNCTQIGSAAWEPLRPTA